MDAKFKAKITCHDEFCICRGECMLAKQDDYFQRYSEICQSLIDGLQEGLQEGCSNVSMEINLGSQVVSENGMVAMLFDSNLDRSNDGLVVPTYDGNNCEMLQMSLFKHFVAELNCETMNTLEFRPRTHLLLWCSVCSLNYSVVENVLGALKGQISICVLQSLLLRAIRLHSPEMVSLLLEHGAFANKTLRYEHDGEFEYGGAVNELRPISLCITLFANSTKFTSELERILELLFATCEGLFAPVCDKTNDSDLHALPWINFVWKNSPRAAQLILEKAGRYVNEPNVDGLTALDCKLDSLVQLVPSSLYARDRFDDDDDEETDEDGIAVTVYETIAFTVLPFMRSGGRSNVRFEDFYTKKFWILYREFVEKKYCERMWGQQESFLLQLCLEARGYDDNRLDFLLFKMEFIEYQDGIERAEALFPLRLQTLARRAILRRLPFGYLSRSEAIKSLLLPTILENYLNFSEFDINL